MSTTTIDNIPETFKLDVFLKVIQELRELAVLQPRYEKLVPSIETAQRTVITAAVHRDFPDQKELEVLLKKKNKDKSFYVLPDINITDWQDKLDIRFNGIIECLQSIPAILQSLDCKPDEILHKSVYNGLVEDSFGTKSFFDAKTWMYDTQEANEPENCALAIISRVKLMYPHLVATWTDVLDRARFTEQAIHQLRHIFCEMRDIDDRTIKQNVLDQI
jgi:hypothetical protein